jgi:enterochelin esterase-like enzyme
MNLFSKSVLCLLINGLLATKILVASSIVEVSYFSKTMNSTRKMNVYLPDGYANSTIYYPTFYLMHGGGQRYYTWANTNDGNAKAILDLAISSGKTKPMIVVMPDVPDFAPDLFTRELCNDVIPFVEKTYRAKTDKDSRALAGLSWGGLQVLDAGLYRYDLFGYMGVFSSGWFIGDNVYNVMKTYLAANGAKIQQSMRYLYYGQGGTGDIAYNNGVETMKVLRANSIKVNYWEHPGGHSFVCWRLDLRDFLPFLFQYEDKTNTPYKGVAHTIPGLIQLEEYDEGGNNVAYMDDSPGSDATPVNNYRTDEDVDVETCTDNGGGYNLGYTKAGEWLEYSVHVATSGKYDLNIRVACNGEGRTLSVDMNSVLIAKDIAMPNTTAWQTWETITVKGINLSAGPQIMRLTIGAQSYINLNYVEFKGVVTDLAESDISGSFELYPNPFERELKLKHSNLFSYKLYNTLGQLVAQDQHVIGEKTIGGNLEKGLYTLEIISKDKSYIHKIIKK